MSALRVEWRYLPTGSLVHIVETPGGDVAAVCGRSAAQPEDWRGTGSQEEYERAESLRKCPRCAYLAGAS